MRYFLILLLFAFGLTSCIAPSADKARSPSSERYTLDTPPGFDSQEEDQFWHLSEGADVYPFAWAYHLTNLNREKRSPYLSDMTNKYGMIFDGKNNQITAHGNSTKYLIPYVGLSVAWSGKRGLDANVFKPSQADALTYKEFFNAGKKYKSIAMMGTNCALCHTSQINYKGSNRLIEGGAAMFDSRGFFQDMAASTIKLMLDESELAEFLTKFGHSRETVSATACDFVIGFKSSIDVMFFKVPKRDKCISGVSYPVKEKPQKKDIFFKSIIKGNVKKSLAANDRRIMRDHLEKLLRITVFRSKGRDGSESDVTNELKARMNWFSKLALQYPKTKETLPGYGRTDAFGRIGNTVARYNDPVPLTANVSIPSIWGVKYRDLFHYNANTNSVLMRNIGQTFGLGAVLINNSSDVNDYESTTSIAGLIQLENLMYKIKVPQWTKIMGDKNLDKKRIMGGCKVYVRSCRVCHGNNKRVGPGEDNFRLIEYKTFPLNKKGLRTDPNQSVMQAKLIDGKPLKDVLFNFTKKVRDQFVEKNPSFDINQNKKIDMMESSYSLRGEEEFRDTYLGQEGSENSYVDMLTGEGGGYSARHLAGVWASPPYLHNGSVASVMELLTPPARRARKFFVGEFQYDDQKMGVKQIYSPDALNVLCRNSPEKCFIAEDPKYVEKFYWKLDRYLKDGEGQLPNHRDADGLGNFSGGHYKSSWDSFTEEDKKDLIEFLKVLKPVPEYSWGSDDGYYSIQGSQCVAGKKISENL